MRGADGVAAHVLHNFELAFHSPFVEGCTQASEVVVEANTFYLNRLSVQEEAFLNVEFERPYPESEYVFVG